MKTEHPVVWSVEFYVDARDRAPALEFLKSLPKQDQAELLRVLDLLGEFGLKIGMPHARPVEGMWELRGGSVRCSTLHTRAALHRAARLSQTEPGCTAA